MVDGIPCTITDPNREDKASFRARFIGVSQFSQPVEPSPMVGGHPGGVVAYPVAVIEYEETGQLDGVPLAWVVTDRAKKAQ